MPAGEEKESDIAAMANWTYMDVFKTLPALMAIKDSVSRAAESSLAEGIVYERRQLHARFASDDAREGMSAFLEKRPPQFQHC